MPINFSSENYSKNAVDFYNSVQQEKMNEIFKTPKLSDITEQYEQRVKNTSFALQYGMAAEAALDEEEAKTVSEEYDNIMYNSFAPFRLDPKEVNERIARDNRESLRMIKVANEAGIENLRFEGGEEFKKTIQYAMAFPLTAPNVMNNRLIGYVPDNLGGTFYDLSESWSEASYTNAINAHKVMSMFGQVPESVSRGASMTIADDQTKGSIKMLLDMIKKENATFDPSYDENFVLRQSEAMALEDSVSWNKNAGFFEGAGRFLVSSFDTLGGAFTNFGDDGPVLDFLGYKDKIWMGDKETEGIRDLLLNAIETSDNLDPKIKDWLSNNPDVLDLLKNSSNGAAFTAGLNEKRFQYKAAVLEQETQGNKTFGAYAKIFGHGFMLDPTLGLDIAATIGTGGLKAGGMITRGGLRATGRLLSLGTSKQLASRTGLLTRLNRQSIAALTRESKFFRLSNFLKKGTDQLSLLQKVMPTQILSELLVPLSRRLLTSGKDEGVDLLTYLKGNDYLPKSVTGKAMYRAIAGSVEGLVWGRIEYSYAAAYEDSLNVAMFGQEQADVLSYMRNQSGAMTQSMLMGGVMGGLLGPAIGGTFDAAGASVTGTANLINKWSEVSPDNWLNKTTAFAEKNFNERIAKTSWWNVTKSIINVATENNMTADARLSVNKAIPKIEFGQTDESASNSARTLEEKLYQLSEKSHNSGAVNFQKAVDEVVNSIPEGETVSAEAFTIRVENALVNQVQDRAIRLGLRYTLVTGTVKTLTDFESDAKRNELTNDGKPAEPVTKTEGNEFSVEAERLAEVKKTKETELAAEEEKIEKLREALAAKREANKNNPDEADTEGVAKLEEEIKEASTTIENMDKDIKEVGLQVAQAAANYAATNKESVITNQAVFNKLLKEKLLDDINKQEDMHPIAAMMLFGMDETLVRKMKNGATLEQKAVLDKLLALNPDDAPLDSNEIASLKDVIEDNFLEEIGKGDEVVPHTLFDQLIKEGISTESAFNEAYNFSFEELAADDARRGQAILVDEEGNSLLTKEQQTSLNEAIAKVAAIRDKINEGNVEDLNFNKAVLNELAEALGIEKPNKIKDKTKLAAKIKEAWDNATQEQRDAYDNIIIDRNFTDDIFKSKATQNIEAVIREAVEEQADDLVTREQQKARDESDEYQNTTDEIDEALAPFREQKRNAETAPNADRARSNEASTNLILLGLVEANKINDMRTQKFINLLSEGQFGAALEMLVVRESDDPQQIKNNKWAMAMEKGIGTSLSVKEMMARARDGKDPNAAQYLRSELPRAWRERGDGLKINTIEVDEQIKSARDYLAENGTDQQKKHFAALEKKQKSQREAIDRIIESRRQDIIDRKVRLAAERVIAESRPAIGFVKPILKALQSINGHIIRAKNSPKNVTGSIETEFSYDISINKEELIGVLKANNLLGLMLRIDTESGALNKKVDSYDSKIVMNALQDKLVSVAPALRDTFIPGLQRIYDNMYNNKIDGTGLYKGDGSIRNLLDSMEDVLDEEASFYTTQFNNNGGRYYDNNNAYTLDADSWDSDFTRAINRLDFGDYFNDTPSITPEQKAARVLNDLNDSLGNRKLTRPNELGSTRAALGPKRAARAVRSALLGEKATTSSVSETSLVVTGGRREAKRTLGANRATGIQKETDSQLINMFDEYVVQKRQGYFLDDDLTDEDLDVLENWLENLKVKDIPNRVRAENSLLPTPVIRSLTEKLPQNIKERVEQNKINMLRSDPAFMSTVHDAIFPMLSSEISTSGQHFAWNFSKQDKDGNTFYPFRGLGFGFPIADARPDTINAALAAATEITFNYENLISTAFETWKSGKWRSKLKPETRENVPEDMSFGEFFFGGEIEKLSVEEQKAISEELFPTIGEFDADASGNNVMVSIVNGVEGAGATRDFLSELVKEVDAGRLDEFLESNYKTSYERTKEIVQNDLNDPTTREAVKKAASRGEASPDLDEAIEISAKIFNYADADGNPLLDLKAIMKNPSMTQPYGAGVGSMAKAIYENFFVTYRDKLISDNEIPLTTSNFERMARTASQLLANGFHESSAKEGLSWVNTNLFGKGSNMNNEKLRTVLTKFRSVRKSLTGASTLRGSGDAIKDPTGLRAMVADNESKQQELNSIIDGNRPIELSEADSFNNLLRQMMGQAVVLTDNGFAKNNTESANGIRKLIMNMVRDAEGNTDLQDAIKNKNYPEARRLWKDITDQDEINNIKLSSLNSYIRQAHKFDLEKFKSLLTSLGLEEEFAMQIFDNLSPMGRKAFVQNFFRELAIGPDHGRIYTKTTEGPDLLIEKLVRPDETAAFSIAGMKPDNLSRDPEVFDAEIRRLTLLDLAKKASSFVEDEDMPVLSKGKFESSTHGGFLNEWKNHSELSRKLRKNAKDQIRRIDNLLFEDMDNGQKEKLDVLRKMLSKIVDSGTDARDGTIDDLMVGITGSEMQQQVNALPSALGYLPKTFLSDFNDAPATILRKAQLERTQNVKTMRSLEKQIKDKRVTVQQDPFTIEELAYVKTLDNIDDIKPIAFKSMLPTSVFDTVALNISDSPSLRTTRAVLQTELDNFVDNVKNLGGNKVLEEAASKGKYDVVLLHYFATLANKEAMKTRQDIALASSAFEKQKRDFVDSLEETDPDKIINAIKNNRSLQDMEKKLNLLIEASLLEEESTLRSLTQWGFDAKRNITDLYDLRGESVDSVFPGQTIEEAIQNTIVNNDVTAGNLLAWLANDAEFLGQVLLDDPNSRYVDSYGGDNPERALNALGVFSTGDSPSLYLSAYAQNYAKRYTVSAILGKSQDKITSAEIQAYRIWKDAKYKLDSETMDRIKTDFPELVEALEKPENLKNILTLEAEGLKQATKAFDNTALLSEITRNIPLTESVAADLLERYPNIETIIGKVSPDMTLERLLSSKSENLLGGKHKALVNQFGDVTAPHRIIGNAKIKLMAGEKLNTVNSIGSKDMIDAIRFTSTLSLESLPFGKSLGDNITGHDPFTKFGSSISKTRRQAAILSEAIKGLVKGKPEAEFVVDKRNSFISEGKAKQAEFVTYSNAQIEAALSSAEQTMAQGILRDLNLTPVELDKIFNTDDNVARNKNDVYRAARLVPFLSENSSEYNIFKKQQAIKDSLKGKRAVNDLDAFNDFKDNVLPILTEIKKAIQTKKQNAIKNDPDFKSNDINSVDLVDDWFTSTIRSADIADDNNTPVVNGNQVYDSQSVESAKVGAVAKAEQTSLLDRTDGSEAMKGVNTVDFAFSDKQFIDNGPEHLRFIEAINPLVTRGVLTNDDKLLLKIVFNDRSNNTMLKQLFDEDDSVTMVANDANVSLSDTSAATLRTRIEVANNLAKQFDKIGKLGAAGVVLEELGHAIGKRMSKDGMQSFIIRAKQLLKDEDGFNAFIALEKELFGAETRVDYSNRVEHIRKFIDEEDIKAVRSNETFGILFAITSILGKDTRALLNEDTDILAKLYSDSNHYISRLRSYYSVAESSPVSIDDLTHPMNIEANLHKVVYNNPDEISSEMIGGDPRPDFKPNHLYNRATEVGTLPEQREAYLDENIKAATIADGRFNPNLLDNNTQNKLRAVTKHLDSFVKDASKGTLIDSPMFTLMANASMGLMSRQTVEKLMLNLAQPFGARRFAFLANNKDGQSGISLLLLGMVDTKNLVSTSSFNTALPTMQGLQVHLDGVFEPLMKPLLDLKRINSTRGMTGVASYQAFTGLFWKMVMNRDGDSGAITGWAGKTKAKQIGIAELDKIYKKANEELPFDPETGKITDPELDHTLDILVETARAWADPKDGVYQQILTAQVDNGRFDSTFAAEAIMSGVVPIKFADELFTRGEMANNPDLRETFRKAFADHLYSTMTDRNNKFIHEDLFSLVFADRLEGDIDAPTRITGMDLASGVYQKYLDEASTPADAWANFTNDIKQGKLSKYDLLSGEELQYFYESINQENITVSEKQNKMMNNIENRLDSKTPRSGKKSSSSANKERLIEFVAEEYALTSGSSAYSFINDRFVDNARLLDDPNIERFLNVDPLEVFDAVKRGQAGQAFDRQIVGNALGMQGFGVGDLIRLLRYANEDSTFKPEHVIVNSNLQGYEKRTLGKTEQQKYSKVLEYLEDAYHMAMGNLSYDKTDKSSIGFISMLTTIADAGTALSVGPRLGMAALLEETPMAIIGELKSSLDSIRQEGRESIGFFKNLGNREALQQWIQGMGHITRDLQRESSTLMLKMGIDPKQISQNRADKAVQRMYKVSSTGLDYQTAINRARGVRKWINELNSMFVNEANADISFTHSDGHTVSVSSRNLKSNASFDTVYEVVQGMGDLTRYTSTEIKDNLKQLKLSAETLDAVIDMMRNGLFSEELAPIFKKLWLENYNTIIKQGIPFEEMMKTINFDYNSSAKERAQTSQVIMALREIAFNASTRYAKQPTLSENAALGSRRLGAFSRLVTQLTNYASSVFGSLRKAQTVSPALFASAFLGHAISGYMYYKLVQMQNSKTFEEILKEWEKDPMSEIRDALMSVPFFGMNQMPIVALTQVLRGERPQNTQIFNFASLAMINKILQLPAKTMKSVGDIQEGNISRGAANMSSTVPLPFMPIVSLGLRSWDTKMPLFGFKDNSKKIQRPKNPPKITKSTPATTSATEPNVDAMRQRKPETTPRQELDSLNTTPESLTEALNQRFIPKPY